MLELLVTMMEVTKLMTTTIVFVCWPMMITQPTLAEMLIVAVAAAAVGIMVAA